MAGKRYFTLAEANAQVPSLVQLFTGVMQVRAQLKALYGRLDEAGFAPTGEDDPEQPVDAPADVRRDRARFFGLVEALREQVEEIHATGCVIKDIETGLVDWLARHEGREVWLCWRFGEPEIAWWHELDTGFAGRRHVSELSPSATGGYEH